MKKIFTVILAILLVLSIAGNVVLFVQYRNSKNNLSEANKKIETLTADYEVAQQEIKGLKDKNDGLEKKNQNLASKKIAVESELNILKQQYMELRQASLEMLEYLETYDLQWQFEFSFE